MIPFFAVNSPGCTAKPWEANLTAAYLGPLMALLAVTMVTGLFSGGFNWLYPARVVGTAAALWFFWRRSITRLDPAWSWSWAPVGGDVVETIYFQGVGDNVQDIEDTFYVQDIVDYP